MKIEKDDEMNKEATDKKSTLANSNTPLAGSKKGIIQLKEHIVEIISDSGEGAQKWQPSLSHLPIVPTRVMG